MSDKIHNTITATVPAQQLQQAFKPRVFLQDLTPYISSEDPVSKEKWTFQYFLPLALSRTELVHDNSDFIFCL
jgi:hypothetical protein